MRVLVSYDGSTPSDAAIDDLPYAGFPEEDVEALAISIAEVWMPPPPKSNGNGFKPEEFPAFVNEWAEKRLEVAKAAVNEAETLARHAKERIQHRFPKWKVDSYSTYGSPAWEVLIKADEFKPDVIVVGSKGRNAVSKILIGSVSQKILTEAECSVRIARTVDRDKALPQRLLIGYDGSNGSEHAVETVLSRTWPEGTEVLLVSAVQSLVPTAIGRFIPPIKEWVGDESETEKNLISQLAAGASMRLEKAGLSVAYEVIEGNPKEEIVEKAEKWQASCVFMGAHAYHSELAKLLIGCTSSAVAERAHCTVEAVRV
ncbi:MAG: universal stress protein [Pyrinomonadaceae bacterium]|nr:universal stress protein [Pyrinomonadaceae bacterium]